MLTEKDIKKELKRKYNAKEFKFDTKKNQKFIEIVNANFYSETGYIVYHDHHVTNEQWYIDNYEPLIEGQIEKIVELIKQDPDTRQAYIGMLRPEDYHNGDKICTIGMQVIYNKSSKTVDYIVYMRSNNVCEYTEDSNWQTKIYTKIINEIISNVDKEAHPGYMYWNVGSLHLYEEDFQYLSNNTAIAEKLIRDQRELEKWRKTLSKTMKERKSIEKRYEQIYKEVFKNGKNA